MNLTEILIQVDDVDKNIVSAEFQPILDSNDLHDFGLFLAEFFKVLENLEDFSFFGAALAAHQVADLEGNEIWWGSPSCLGRKLGVVEFF